MVGPEERFAVVDGDGGEDAAAIEHRRRHRRDARLRRFEHHFVEVDYGMHFDLARRRLWSAPTATPALHVCGPGVNPSRAARLVGAGASVTTPSFHFVMSHGSPEAPTDRRTPAECRPAHKACYSLPAAMTSASSFLEGNCAKRFPVRYTVVEITSASPRLIRSSAAANVDQLR